MLADLAVREPKAFSAVVATAKQALIRNLLRIKLLD